jgi:ectoine hydroxylase-related dioxygenase (phytanoyl-CoA dioxygenase family)
MESSKFWKLRELWFRLKRLPELYLQLFASLKHKLMSWHLKNTIFFSKNTKKINRVLATNVALLNQKPIIHIDSPSEHIEYNGLVVLSGKIIYFEQTTLDSHLEITFNNNEWTKINTNNIEENSEDLKPYSTFQVSINSFLLPKGINIIYIRLLNSSGEEITKEQIYFKVDNSGELAEAVAQCFRKSNFTQPILQGMLDSSDFPYDRCEVVAWFDREDAIKHIPNIVNKYSLPPEFVQHFTNFVNLGYISLDSFIPLDLVEQTNDEIDRLIKNGDMQYIPESGNRIEHLFEKSPAVRKIWTYPSIIKLLSALFDDQALPCQTLNFIHGSQQDVHQDTIHLTPFPEGYMCGVWIALEDINPNAGPLFVYPKSHKLPPLYAKTIGINKVNNYWSQHLIEEYKQKYFPRLKSDLSMLNLQPVEYTPKAGSVFIWHANLAHGGSSRKVKNLTRKSMVSHYFARGVVAFYDTTGTVGYKHRID